MLSDNKVQLLYDTCSSVVLACDKWRLFMILTVYNIQYIYPRRILRTSKMCKCQSNMMKHRRAPMQSAGSTAQTGGDDWPGV